MVLCITAFFGSVPSFTSKYFLKASFSPWSIKLSATSSNAFKLQRPSDQESWHIVEQPHLVRSEEPECVFLVIHKKAKAALSMIEDLDSPVHQSQNVKLSQRDRIDRRLLSFDRWVRSGSFEVAMEDSLVGKPSVRSFGRLCLHGGLRSIRSIRRNGQHSWMCSACSVNLVHSRRFAFKQFQIDTSTPFVSRSTCASREMQYFNSVVGSMYVSYTVPSAAPIRISLVEAFSPRVVFMIKWLAEGSMNSRRMTPISAGRLGRSMSSMSSALSRSKRSMRPVERAKIKTLLAT
ncbi:hypothetical protein KC328_g86 [Hortaea werneckii]|nr:hypothetical protein KC328_g86 [Hortaea werneckii]